MRTQSLDYHASATLDTTATSTGFSQIHDFNRNKKCVLVNNLICDVVDFSKFLVIE